MPKLHEYASLFEEIEHQDLQFVPLQCIRARNRNVECTRCADACPAGCIEVCEEGVRIDAESCLGCGSCATACPVDAIFPRSPTDAEIAKAAQAALTRTDGTAVFACARAMESAEGHVDPEKVTGVSCLGRLDESLLMATVAAGATRVRLVCGACEGCPCASGGAIAREVTRNARALVEAWGLACKLKCGSKFPTCCALAGGAGYDYERREVLLGMKGKAKLSGMQAGGLMLGRVFDEGAQPTRFSHVGSDGTLPHFTPQNRKALLSLLERLGEPRDVSVQTRLWGHVSIDAEACNGCQMCAVFCPTGALAKYAEPEDPATRKGYRLYRAPGNPHAGAGEVAEAHATRHHVRRSASSSITATGEVVTLAHAPDKCVACRCCEQVCPQHALQIGTRVNARDIGRGYVQAMRLKDIYEEKGGPNAICNSMRKIIDSPYVWG